MASPKLLHIISLLAMGTMIYCHNHHDHQLDTWLSFLPGFESFMKNLTTTNDTHSSTDSTKAYEIYNSTNIPELMSGTENSSGSSTVTIGSSIGGIIMFFLICWCCYRCCCARCGDEVIVQNTVVQSAPAQPTSANPMQIVVQQVAPPIPMPQYEMRPPGQQQWGPPQQQYAPQQQQQYSPPPQYSSEQYNPGNASAPPNYGKY